MKELPYRTGKTWLTDKDLILLDVMLDGRVSFRLLRDPSFRAQWNLGYSHGLKDAELRERLAALEAAGVLTPTGEEHFGLTSAGGKLWSDERCPVWERYCVERYNVTRKGTTLCTVAAISPEIRDTFLQLWPCCEAKTRCRTVPNYDLIYWKPFPQVYVGAAAYKEPSSWTVDEYRSYVRDEYNHNTYIEQERTWWRSVAELQRFIPTG